jgi:hypothetical protein
VQEGPVTGVTSIAEVIVMWNWILLAVIVGGLVALVVVVSVRQRRYGGEKPMSDHYKDGHKTFPGGGSGAAGGV